VSCDKADGFLAFLMRENVAKGFDEFQIHLRNCSECQGLLGDILLLRAVEKITREEWEEIYRKHKRLSPGYTD
jgi:hypothetical protein